MNHYHNDRVIREIFAWGSEPWLTMALVRVLGQHCYSQDYSNRSESILLMEKSGAGGYPIVHNRV